MGFNATVVVLLDRLSEIERDPEFGQKLCKAIRYKAAYGDREGPDIFGDTAPGQTQVVEVHHADQKMVIAVGGNCGRVLGWGGGYAATNEQIVKELSRQYRKKKETTS